ncbi:MULTISPECIES: FGGY family carbohydrate kinase [unclassified Arthrobacter]|uniref:xylulokinase n=1 Tax=unclassified Arthrobacter TaxID=235627 RepID=UPI001E45FC21|nr:MULTISPECIES: FGGY family carbohydrate kinase [unclassified Arthrobacter]MCC9145972.1 Hsp70 family protein [Arthrobacter sp. zg-Y919]MDK1277201.1 FGGY family carbohydrate kinase [Arthrobacter sp. zg.Y919]WIB03715.1 FGGY family carbohydrate kinase [Arthrobacter sp. zg-Y919]
MPLVAGVDSSTQSCKIVIRDAQTGALLREGTARHPAGTEVDPEAWWSAFREAAAAAGGLDDVDAVSVGGQQHGMVCLDETGAVIRPALLWNDVRSAAAADKLIADAGPDGARYWADTTGTVPVASITAAKLRWLAENEPENAARTAAVCLPHDWLSWRLAGFGPGSGAEGLAALTTDRSDASGTGYWSPSTGEYLPEVLEQTLGHVPQLPRVLGPLEAGGRTPAGALIGPGAGDNAAAGLGVAAGVGDVVVSIGTSGTVFAVVDSPASDATGLVAGFADATGHFLPLTATLNASRVLDATAALLGVDLNELTRLALSAPAGAGGLVMVPYFEGERTPNLPDATGSLHGMTLQNFTSANLARAAVEAVACSLADGFAALKNTGVTAQHVILVGGAARSEAVQQAIAAIFELPVTVPRPGEYVADGAARQAAAVLTGAWPEWSDSASVVVTADPTPEVLHRYRQAARRPALPAAR